MQAAEVLGRRERRKIEVRERILEASHDLFSEYGFHETTVSEICDRADVARKTFFNHFASKQFVLRVMAHDSIDEFVGDIETIREECRTTTERLTRVFARVAERTEAAGPMHRDLVTEFVHAINESAEKSAETLRIHEAFETIIREGVKAGEVVRTHSVETLTQMILGAFYVLMFDYANLEDFPIGRQARAYSKFLNDAIATPHDA